MGSDIFLHTTTNDGNHKLIARATPYEGQNLSIGDELHLQREPNKTIVFDTNGSRLLLAPAMGKERK